MRINKMNLSDLLPNGGIDKNFIFSPPPMPPRGNDELLAIGTTIAHNTHFTPECGKYVTGVIYDAYLNNGFACYYVTRTGFFDKNHNVIKQPKTMFQHNDVVRKTDILKIIEL
jgi:hypothetical protein